LLLEKISLLVFGKDPNSFNITPEAPLCKCPQKKENIFKCLYTVSQNAIMISQHPIHSIQSEAG
jgi:hypothetical protein